MGKEQIWGGAVLTDKGLGITRERFGACRDNRLDRGKTITQSVSQVVFCFPTLAFHCSLAISQHPILRCAKPGRRK